MHPEFCDRIRTTPCSVNKGIGPLATGQTVIPSAAINGIPASTTVDRVVACTTENAVRVFRSPRKFRWQIPLQKSVVIAFANAGETDRMQTVTIFINSVRFESLCLNSKPVWVLRPSRTQR